MIADGVYYDLRLTVRDKHFAPHVHVGVPRLHALIDQDLLLLENLIPLRVGFIEDLKEHVEARLGVAVVGLGGLRGLNNLGLQLNLLVFEGLILIFTILILIINIFFDLLDTVLEVQYSLFMFGGVSVYLGASRGDRYRIEVSEA